MPTKPTIQKALNQARATTGRPGRHLPVVTSTYLQSPRELGGFAEIGDFDPSFPGSGAGER
jgi:hypothetical protein